MKLTTVVTLQFLLEVDNHIFFTFYVTGVKLTASTNICYISDRVVCTVKVNIKENIVRNNGFLALLMY